MGAIYKNFQTNNGSESDTIFNMSFKNCIEYIRRMDTMSKAKVSAEINDTLRELYLYADRYGNENYEASARIDTAMFEHVMSVIKKWETLLYWLYEIDIQMGEDEISRLIERARERMEEVDWDTETFSVRMIKGEDGKRHKSLVNDNNYYMTLLEKQAETDNHTQEIMDMAKDICGQYLVGGK